ncbi:hypothetical protein DFAR_4040024 [Desulfarculales bacterium]
MMSPEAQALWQQAAPGSASSPSPAAVAPTPAFQDYTQVPSTGGYAPAPTLQEIPLNESPPPRSGSTNCSRPRA